MDSAHAPRDNEGYITNLSDWTPALAEQIASDEGIRLTNAHWEIINLLRDFFEMYELSPAMRPLIKYINQKLSPDKAKSIYLLSLFPGSPPKIAAKIAGLPKPENCL